MSGITAPPVGATECPVCGGWRVRGHLHVCAGTRVLVTHDRRRLDTARVASLGLVADATAPCPECGRPSKPRAETCGRTCGARLSSRRRAQQRRRGPLGIAGKDDGGRAA